METGIRKTMDKKTLEQFRKLLEARQFALRESINRTEQDGRAPEDDYAAQDMADRAASSYNKEFLFHQSKAERQMLQQVDSALSRVREGSFGICITCEEDINSKRMEAVPWAVHCVQCQEKIEQGLIEADA